MPAYEHHFTPLSPPTTQEENGLLSTLGMLNFETQSGHILVLRYLGFAEQIRVIAVTATEDAVRHERFAKWMKQIVETALTAIRLSVDPMAEPFYHGDAFVNMMYQSDDPEPGYPAVITETTNEHFRLSIGQTLGVFQAIATSELAPIAALLAEGQMPTIPPHYRVLSLVRAIELLYENGRERSDALDEFQAQFAALGISQRPFRTALPEIRNRCAHGRGRGRNQPSPFTGIGYGEASLRALTLLLRSVVARGIQLRHGLQFRGAIYQPDGSETI